MREGGGTNNVLNQEKYCNDKIFLLTHLGPIESFRNVKSCQKIERNILHLLQQYTCKLDVGILPPAA